MICPNCKKRMTCTNTYTEILNGVPTTARRHVCDCGKELYTMEQPSDILEVLDILSHRQTEYDKTKRRRKNE